MKREYSKPAIKKVKLVVDEAVLSGCKVGRQILTLRGRRTCASNGCRTAGTS